jgi:uncharacterized protein
MFTAYARLVEQIDGRLARLPRCACPAECDRCCRVSFAVFPVEAFHLREAFLGLPAALADRVRRVRSVDPDGVCPFLLDRRCVVYASRPVLCRMHGHPFVHRREEDGSVAVYPGCEALPLESVPCSGEGIRKVSALDLEGINALLAAVNGVFLREPEAGSLGRRERIPVAEIPGACLP